MMLNHLQINRQTAITRKQGFICRNASCYIHHVHTYRLLNRAYLARTKQQRWSTREPRAVLFAQEFSIKIPDLPLADERRAKKHYAIRLTRAFVSIIDTSQRQFISPGYVLENENPPITMNSPAADAWIWTRPISVLFSFFFFISPAISRLLDHIKILYTSHILYLWHEK